MFNYHHIIPPLFTLVTMKGGRERGETKYLFVDQNYDEGPDQTQNIVNTF